MSGPKRNPDALNTIGIVVVGICGAVLVYVTIVALEAFYVNDSSEIQTMADYGGQDTSVRSLRTEQVNRIGEYGTNPKPAAPKGNEAAKAQSYRIPIDVAMKEVVEGAKGDPSALVPAVGKSDKSTVLPIFGRPKLIPAATTPAPGVADPAAGAAAPAAGTTAPAPAGAAGAAAGSAAANGTTLPSAPKASTGAGSGPPAVGGAGPLDKGATPGTPDHPSGPTAGQAPKGASAAGTATNAGSNAAQPKTTPAKGNGK